MAFDVLVSQAAEQADRGGRTIKVCELVSLHCLPISRGCGIYGRRLEYGRGDAVGERTIDDIAASIVRFRRKVRRMEWTYV